MTKSELIARLAARNPHLYQRDVERIVATVFDEISKALASGHRVELRGFGAFSIKKRDPRTGRNPRTGSAVAGPAQAGPPFPTAQGIRGGGEWRPAPGPRAPAARRQPGRRTWRPGRAAGHAAVIGGGRAGTCPRRFRTA